MKLFLRDQLVFLLLYFLQLGTLLLIIWLDGYSHGFTLVYGTFLCTFFAVVYLIVRYIRHRDVYKRMESVTTQSLEEMMQPLGNAPMAEAFSQMLERQYRLFKEQLHVYETKQREHNTFIQQWVHQMKTPISVIQLLVQEDDDAKASSLREELDRLKRGLQTVLYSARLDRFEQDYVIEPVQLHSLVQNVLSENKSLFIRNQVYPELRISDEWVVESDEKWLAFVMNQLITNAVRYSAGKSQRVQFSAYPRGSHLVLEVRDFGVGIPMEDIRRVFKPYFTGENGRKYAESTGMGLYLVQEICNRLHHTVELESAVGEGTSVRLIFQTILPRLTRM